MAARLLEVGGGRSRRTASGIDLLRSIGLRAAWSRRDAAAAEGFGGAWRRAVYRSIWVEAAAALEAEIGEPSPGPLEVRRGGVSIRVRDHIVPVDGAAALARALDKPLANRTLVEAGLPIPESAEFLFGEFDRALAFLGAGRSPCVVKPAGGATGSGVTTGIRTPGELVRAAIRAAGRDRRLVIERETAGLVYRLLFLDGVLLDVLRRHPPRVTGDGRSTVRELIADENRRRIAGQGWRGLSLLKIDLECVLTLEHAGLSLGSVPQPGRVVPVKRVTNQNAPADNETIRDGISPGLLAEAAAAAAIVGVRLAGVDIVTTDPAVPLAASGGVIIEVNGNPGIHYHYLVADPGGATRVAIPILRRLLEPGGQRTEGRPELVEG